MFNFKIAIWLVTSTHTPPPPPNTRMFWQPSFIPMLSAPLPISRRLLSLSLSLWSLKMKNDLSQKPLNRFIFTLGNIQYWMISSKFYNAPSSSQNLNVWSVLDQIDKSDHINHFWYSKMIHIYKISRLFYHNIVVGLVRTTSIKRYIKYTFLKMFLSRTRIWVGDSNINFKILFNKPKKLHGDFLIDLQLIHNVNFFAMTLNFSTV